MTRTIVIGDVHGDLVQLKRLVAKLPVLEPQDTLIFLGDYVDRGPQSAQVIRYLRADLPLEVPARLVFLRGNHEDAWLRVIREGWPDFVLPPGNGCRECHRSFVGAAESTDPEVMRREWAALINGTFFPGDVVTWMEGLPLWFEDEHAIYVHAGLPFVDGTWLHPSEAPAAQELLWSRDLRFHSDYRGKPVVCGHTPSTSLPQEQSLYTPEDASDLWVGAHIAVIDTGCGKGGFLTALEFPGFHVHESR